MATLHEERSRKGLEGFRLTQRVQGFWDRGDTEIDLVALNEHDRVVRLGTCKRSAERLAPDFSRFDAHVASFLKHTPRLEGWRVEKAVIATRHSTDTRLAAERAGYIPQDLEELTADL